MRYAHQGGVHHRRMVIEDVLDLDAVDVLAAADQHVLGPVDDEAEAFLVQAGQVAGLDPAVDEGLGRGLGLVPVALDHLRTLAPQLADLADRQFAVAFDGHDLQVGDRHGRAAAVGTVLIVLGAVGGGGGRGLGHAPAIAGLGLGEGLDDLAHQFRGRRRAAIGHAFQRRQVVIGPGRVLDQLPGDGGHPAGHGHALALDHLEGADRVPLVHHHQLGPGDQAGIEHGETAGGVEEGHGQQGRALGSRRIGGRRRLTAAQESAGPGAARRHDVGIDIALGGQGALGLSGGAGGVEDGGLVILDDVGLGQGLVGQGGPVIGRAEDLFEADHVGVADLLDLAADIDGLEVRAVGQVLPQPGQTLGVDHHHLGPGIGQAVFQLRPGPPGVQRGDNGPEADGGVEGHRPFRQVAHDDGDAVALDHALGLQFVGEGGAGAEKGLETGPLVLIDQEDALAVGAAGQEHVAQGRRGVLPHPGGHAANGHLLHLERRPGRGEHGVGLGDGHGRPGGLGRGGGRGLFGGFSHAVLQALARRSRRALFLGEQA